MHDRNLLLRFVFGAILGILSLLATRWRFPDKLANLKQRQFDLLFIATYTFSRFLVFFVAFFVLHQTPQADLPMAYVPDAHNVMRGLLPYRDFETVYGPLNPYMDALVLWLKDSPLSIVFFQILCDILSLPFWIGFLRRFLPEAAVRRGSLLYLLQPLVIWDICLDGKNHGFISLLLAISVYAIARRDTLSGISYALSMLMGKILPLIFLSALFFGARKRITWLLSLVALSVPVYVFFVVHGADVTVPVRVQGVLSTPCNLPYLFSSITGLDLPTRVVDVVCLVAVAGAVIYAALAQLRAKAGPERLWRLCLSILLILLTVLLFNKKSDTAYLGMCFFLLCAYTAAHAEVDGKSICAMYGLLSVIDLPVSSFWFWPLKQLTGAQVHTLFLSGGQNGLIMMGLQASLIASYLWFVYKILHDLRKTPSGLFFQT